jgi:hypothetical protein
MNVINWKRVFEQTFTLPFDPRAQLRTYASFTHFGTLNSIFEPYVIVTDRQTDSLALIDVRKWQFAAEHKFANSARYVPDTSEWSCPKVLMGRQDNKIICQDIVEDRIVAEYAIEPSFGSILGLCRIHDDVVILTQVKDKQSEKISASFLLSIRFQRSKNEFLLTHVEELPSVDTWVPRAPTVDSKRPNTMLLYTQVYTRSPKLTIRTSVRVFDIATGIASSEIGSIPDAFFSQLEMPTWNYGIYVSRPDRCNPSLCRFYKHDCVARTLTPAYEDTNILFLSKKIYMSRFILCLTSGAGLNAGRRLRILKIDRNSGKIEPTHREPIEVPRYPGMAVHMMTCLKPGVLTFVYTSMTQVHRLVHGNAADPDNNTVLIVHLKWC